MFEHYFVALTADEMPERRKRALLRVLKVTYYTTRCGVLLAIKSRFEILPLLTSQVGVSTCRDGQLVARILTLRPADNQKIKK